jgi:hypothetical protein
MEIHQFFVLFPMASEMSQIHFLKNSLCACVISMEYSHNNLTWFQTFVSKFVLVSVCQTALFFSHCPENRFTPPNAMKTKGNEQF